MKTKIGLFIGLLFLSFCFLCWVSAPIAEFYATRCYPFVSMVLSRVGALVPFSLEEIVVLGFVVAFICILVKAVRSRKGFAFWFKRTAVLFMWLFVWFYMGWGNNYHRMGLYARYGIQKVSFEAERFKLFLENYSRDLNNAAGMTGSLGNREALEAEIRGFYFHNVTPYGYTSLHHWQKPKRPILNRLFSAVLVHGFMGPFFCEAQVNTELLEYEYPFTVAHEMAHLVGVTSEAEASWWGFACCRESSNPYVRYSGYLAILPYVLSNARGLLHEDEYIAWTETLCQKAKEDYMKSREYWKGKRVGWIDRTQSWFYNLYLRSNGVSEGIKDYYGVVSMIITMDELR